MIKEKVDIQCVYPDFVLSIKSLIFTTKEGSWFNPPAQYFIIARVYGTGGRPLYWRAATSESWAKVRPEYGDGYRKVKVTCSGKGLEAGSYHCQILVGALKRETQAIDVELIVQPRK